MMRDRNDSFMGTSTRQSRRQAEKVFRECLPAIYGEPKRKRPPVEKPATTPRPRVGGWALARVITCVAGAVVSIGVAYLQWTWTHVSVAAETGIAQLTGDVITTAAAEPLRDFLLHVACRDANRPVKINIVPRVTSYRFEIDSSSCSGMTIERADDSLWTRVDVVFVGDAPQPSVTFIGPILWTGSVEPDWKDGVALWLHGKDEAIWGEGLHGKPPVTKAQFGGATSAQLKGVLSEETGTGTTVFATSPTLGTRPIPATPSSGSAYQWIDACRERDSRGRERKCRAQGGASTGGIPAGLEPVVVHGAHNDFTVSRNFIRDVAEGPQEPATCHAGEWDATSPRLHDWR